MTRIFHWALVIIIGTISVSGATFVVTKPADTNDGVCDTDCSLREAVAATDSAPTDDVIQFSDFVIGIGLLSLTGGEITIHGNGDLVINGPPSHFFTISGGDLSRVFFVDEAASVAVEGVTIQGGNGRGVEQGGGGCILNHGQLTLTYTRFINCHSLTSGGAIHSSGNLAELRIINSTITTNRTDGSGSFGGGIANSSNLDISDSTITNNAAVKGGGIYTDSGQSNVATIIRSTVDHNHAPVDGTSNGGGIANYGNLTLDNSTICNNDAAASGGGVFNTGSASISSSTICSNLAGNGPTSAGGGIYTLAPGIATLRNTLVGDNLVHFSIPSDVDGQWSSGGYNLIETMVENVGGTTVGDILGRDADLLPLGNYGGPTKTVSFQPRSYAEDAGNPNNFSTTDQRGVPRPQDGDLIGGERSDIGAYERQPNLFTVTTTEDTNDGQCDSHCSLREALASANVSSAPDDVVQFDPALFSFPQTITLTLGNLLMTSLSGTLLIQGSGRNLLTLSGNDQFRIYNINNAIGAVDRIKITHGRVNGSGGAVGSVGRFSLTNCEVAESYGTSDGSAVANVLGKMSVRNCVIHGNPVLNLSLGILNELEASSMSISDSSIDGSQLGIANEGTMNIMNSTFSSNHTPIYNREKGNMTIEGSTISGNTSSFYTYGELNDGHRNSLTIVNSTISNNIIETSCAFLNEGSNVTLVNSTISGNISSSGTYGCGAANTQASGFSPGTITARNTIFANNGPQNNGYDYFGALTSQGYNLIENTRNTIITGNTTGNIINIDPMLGTLSNNGGPTLTQMPLPGSPLIDTADPAVFPYSDQRSYKRPVDGDGNGTIRADIGATELGARPAFSNAVQFDYDGDGKDDISVFRPSAGAWYLQQSQVGLFGMLFGFGTDKITPADYDGDRKTDIAVFRPSTGIWYVLNSSNGTVSYYVFGLSEDLPTPADYDGDNKADISVFRPSTGTWYRQNSSNGTFFGIQFGASEDKPTVGDFDGDEKADIAVFRPSTGAWYRINSYDGSLFGENFGLGSDVLVPADYEGDGRADLAVYRPSTGIWYLKYSSNGVFDYKVFGLAADIPAPGDFDGDGHADINVFRPSDGTWYRQNSSNGQFIAFQFGTNGDKPTQTALQY